MCLDWLWCLVTMNIISYCLRFDQHADAAQAITAKHGTQLEGYTVKCSWGKEGAGLPSTMGASGYNGVSCEWCHYLTPYFLPLGKEGYCNHKEEAIKIFPPYKNSFLDL